MGTKMKAVKSVVAQPIGEYVVGVKVSSRPIILPRIENGPVSPPEIPQCFDRHIIRTSEGVVVVEVSAQVKVFPRVISLAVVREAVRGELDVMFQEENKSPSSESYEEGLDAMTNRLVKQLQNQGVTVEN